MLYYVPEAPRVISSLYQCYIMYQRRHGLLHLYISVILCTRGATGYFTFISVLDYVPEAPRVISSLYQCYIMYQRRHGLLHLDISVILCTRGATGYFIFISVLYYVPEAPRVISSLYQCYIMYQWRHGLFLVGSIALAAIVNARSASEKIDNYGDGYKSILYKLRHKLV